MVEQTTWRLPVERDRDHGADNLAKKTSLCKPALLRRLRCLKSVTVPRQDTGITPMQSAPKESPSTSNEAQEKGEQYSHLLGWLCSCLLYNATLLAPHSVGKNTTYPLKFSRAQANHPSGQREVAYYWIGLFYACQLA